MSEDIKTLKTMLFNPYTGNPRHPSDIASDPAGVLMLDPDMPLLAATGKRDVIAEANAKLAIAADTIVTYLSDSPKSAIEALTDAVIERDATIAGNASKAKEQRHE
jgi:hypothetical protein